MSSAPQAAAPRRRSDNIVAGIGLTLSAVVIFGVQDAMTKLLMQTYSPFQIAMLRFWAFGAFALILAARRGPLREAFKSRFPRIQVLRAVLLVVDIWLFAAALKHVPLAELQAISLVHPLMATLVAIPLLGEKVGVFRFTAVAVGFGGAMVIVRPGGLPLDIGVLYAMLACAAYAIYVVLTRKVSGHDATVTSMVYVGVGGLVLTSTLGVFFWTPMDGGSMLLAGAVMVTSTAGHGLMMVALSRAPASTLQPFSYMSLPWGIVLSYVVFGHLIDTISLMGGAIIVIAGLVVMERERRLAKRGRLAAPRPAEELPPH